MRHHLPLTGIAYRDFYEVAPQMPPLAAALGSALVAGVAAGSTLTAAGALTIGFSAAAALKSLALGLLSLGAELLLKRSQEKGSSSLDGGRTQNTRDSITPRRVVYGKTRVGGPIVHMEATRGKGYSKSKRVWTCEGGGEDRVCSYVTTTEIKYGKKDEFLSMVIPLAGHEIDGVEELYLDDILAFTEGNGENLVRTDSKYTDEYVEVELKHGKTNQTAFSDLVLISEDNKWTNAHRGRGVAALHTIFRWDKEQKVLFGGTPNISAILRGRKVYDPRTQTTAWSDNPALCLLDFIRGFQIGTRKIGVNVPDEDIDFASFIAAANHCDEQVTLAGGGSEKRYTLNGTFDLAPSTQPITVIEEMLTSMAGRLTYTAGQFRLRSSSYTVPAITFEAGDLRAPFTIQTRQQSNNLYNAVQGTFVSPEDLYNPVSYPSLISDAYAAEDGEVRFADYSLPFTTSASMAQRLVKLELNRSRQQIGGVLQLDLSALDVATGDIIAFDYLRFGWIGKEFEVMAVTPVSSDVGLIGFDITVVETSAAIYDWLVSDEIPYLAGAKTNLESIIEPPTNFALSPVAEPTGDGGTTPFVLASWDESDTSSVTHYEVRWRLHGETVYFVRTTSETSYKIGPLPAGYPMEVTVRAVTASGRYSNYVAFQDVTAVGDTTAPTAPSNVSVGTGVGLLEPRWTNGPEDDLAGVAVKRSLTNSEPVQEYKRVAATGPGAPGSFVDSGLSLAANYKYWLASYDRSGNISDFVGPFAGTTEKVALVDTTGVLQSAQIAADAINQSHLANDAVGLEQLRPDVTDEINDAAQSALSDKNAAEAAATAANTSRTLAETAKNLAETAQQAAETAELASTASSRVAVARATRNLVTEGHGVGDSWIASTGDTVQTLDNVTSSVVHNGTALRLKDVNGDGAYGYEGGFVTEGQWAERLFHISGAYRTLGDTDMSVQIGMHLRRDVGGYSRHLTLPYTSAWTTFEGIAPISNATTYEGRPRLRIINPNGTANVTLDVANLVITDVTESEAAGQSASAAATSQQAASISETNAGQSASAADTSRVNAETARGGAETAATNAAQSATTAQGSASSAATSATVSSQSESEAVAARDAAQTAQGAAEDAEDAAQTSANNAASSASAASTSAALATTKASEAEQSATSATTSKNQAATSAGQALTYRNDAASSASDADGFRLDAETASGVAVDNRNRAAALAAHNLITKGTFEDGSIGRWTGSTTIVGVGSGHPFLTNGIRVQGVSALEGESNDKLSGPFGGRILRFTGYVIRVGDTPRLLAGVQETASDGSTTTRSAQVVSDTETGWRQFSVDLHLSADVTEIRPWVRAANTGGATFDHRWTDLRIEDVTDSVNAENAATAAATSAQNASTSETAAETAATAASSSSVSATAARNAAQDARDDAEDAQGAAATSASAASTSASSAAASATTAGSHATTATTQASNASTSASQASSYRNTTLTARDDAIGARDDAQDAASEASTTAGIVARIAKRGMARNPTFLEWPSTNPTGWGITHGAVSSMAKIGSQNGAKYENAVQLYTGANSTENRPVIAASINGGGLVGPINPEYVVVTIELEGRSGTFAGSVIQCTWDADPNKSVGITVAPEMAGIPNQTITKIEKVVKRPANVVNPTNFVVYYYQRHASHSPNASNNVHRIHSFDVREASEEEIRVYNVGGEINSNVSAAVAVESQARATAIGQVESNYTIRTTAVSGGERAVAGIGLVSTSSPNGAPSSAINLLADEVKIFADASATAKPLFATGDVNGTPTVIVNGDFLADGGIYGRSLHASVLNKVQNPARVSDASELTGWTGDVHGIAAPSTLGGLTSLRIRATTAQGSATVTSARFDVDPLRTYKFQASVYSGNSDGTRYLSVRYYDKNGAAIVNGTRISQNANGVQTEAAYTGNPYLFSVSGTLGTRHVDAYLIGAEVETGSAPFGDSAYRHNRIPANAAQAAVVFRTSNQDTGTGNAYLTNITIADADAGLITGERMVVGSIQAQSIATNAITTDKIAANAVTAAEINVTDLAAISADLGTVTVTGNISSSNFNNATETGFQIRPDGKATFHGVVLSRQLEVDSGTIQVSNIGSNSGWDLVRTAYVESTAVTLSAWAGLEETYIAEAGFGSGIVVSVDDDDIPDGFWGVRAIVIPATRWSGGGGYGQTIRLRLEVWCKNVDSIKGAGGASTFPINWRIYKVT